MLVLFLAACSVAEAPAPAPTPLQQMHEAIAACQADPACMEAIKVEAMLGSEELGSCSFWAELGCVTVVSAALAVCVDPVIGELCLEALEAVADIGCCDCIPKGPVRDACKAI